MADNNKSFDLYKQAIEEFELKDVEELLEKAKSSAFVIKKNVVKKLDKNDSELSETERKLLDELNKKKDIIKFLEEVLNKLKEKEKEKIKKELSNVGNEMNKNKLKSEKLKKEILEIKEKIKQQENIIIKNTEKNSQLKEKTKEIKSKIKKLRQELEEIKKDKNLKPDDKKNKIKNILAEIETLKGESEGITIETTKLAVNSDEARRKIEIFNKELLPKENELKGLESKLGDTGQKVEEIAKKALKLGDRELAESVKFMKGTHNITEKETKKVKKDVQETKNVTNTAKMVVEEQLKVVNDTFEKSEKNKEELQSLEIQLNTIKYIKYNPYNKGSIDYFNKNPGNIKNITSKKKLLEVLKNSKFENNDTNIIKHLKDTNTKRKIKPENYINSIFLSDPEVLNAFNEKFHTKFNTNDTKNVNFEYFENFEAQEKVLKEEYKKLQIYEKYIKDEVGYKKIKDIKEKINWLKKARKNSFKENNMELEDLQQLEKRYSNLKQYEQYVSENDKDSYDNSSLVEKVKKLEKIEFFAKTNDTEQILKFISNLDSQTRINFVVKNYGEDQTKVLLAKLQDLNINDKKQIQQDLDKVLEYRNYKKEDINNFIKENKKDIYTKGLLGIDEYLRENKKSIDYKYLDNLIASLIKNVGIDEKKLFIESVFRVLWTYNIAKNIQNMPRFHYYFTNASNENKEVIRNIILERPEIYNYIFNIKQQQDFVLDYIDGLKKNKKLENKKTAIKYLSNIKIKNIYQAKEVFRKLKEYGFKEKNFFDLMNNNKISSEMNRIAQGINLDNFKYDEDIGDVIKIIQANRENIIKEYQLEFKKDYGDAKKSFQKNFSNKKPKVGEVLKITGNIMTEMNISDISFDKSEKNNQYEEKIKNKVKEIIKITLENPGNTKEIDDKIAELAQIFVDNKIPKTKFKEILNKINLEISKLNKKDFDNKPKVEKDALIKEKILNNDGDINSNFSSKYNLELEKAKEIAKKEAEKKGKKFNEDEFVKKFTEKFIKDNVKNKNISNESKKDLYKKLLRSRLQNHFQAIQNTVDSYSLSEIANRNNDFWRGVDTEEKKIIVNQINAGNSGVNAYIDSKTGEIKFHQYKLNQETGVLKYYDINGQEIDIKLSKKEQEMAKRNPEVLKNIVNFYEKLEKVGLKKLWIIKDSIFKSISNIEGIGFNIDGDYLNENEVKIFFNAILKSVGEQEIPLVFTLDNFISKIEKLNKVQFNGNEAIENVYYKETYLENKFFNKFVGRNNTIINFNQSKFEEALSAKEKFDKKTNTI